MSRNWLIAVALILAPFALVLDACGDEPGSAAGILAKIGGARGFGVLLGDRDGRLAIPLARQSDLVWLVQFSDPAVAEAAARAADAAGLYGTRIYVASGKTGQIGLADDLADAVVAVDPAGIDKAEVLRVLRPERRAFVGGEVWTKPKPDGVDDWSHHYHGPDNNPQSLDRIARAPYLTRFIAEPRYAPAPQAAVAAGGRVFMAFGHVAWHQREELVLNSLVVLDGYHGTLLWKRPLTPGIMVDRSTMIATPSILYLGDEKSCKMLDAASGRLMDEIVVPSELAGGTFWKWMALEGGTLYALVGPPDPLDSDARWRSTSHGWPWDGISKGYNEPEYRWGYARTLLAIDPTTKRILWSHQEDPPIDSRSICLKNGRIYLGSFGHYLECLDARDGQSIWERTAEKDAELFSSIGPYRPGHGYVGGWKSTVYLKCTDKALYFVGPQVNWLTAVSTEDGRVLWKHPAKDLHLVIRDDGLYTIAAQDSRDASKKLDPLTGQVLATFATKRRACTRSTGCADSVFFRAAEGSARLNTESGSMQWISSMRPSCHVGVVISDGHLYWLPWACDCDLQLFGAISLGPAGHFAFDQEATDADRLETRAPATVAVFPVDPADWPAYRANNARTAQTPSAIPAAVAVQWQFSPRRSVSALAATADPAANLPHDAIEPTAPIAAGGLVFYGSGDGTVRALDAATGKLRWTAYTGGAIHFPPAIAKGLALVGSGDGWAYAFEAATGRLVWRFRAAPAERRIPVYSSLSSTWPVAGGVLADGDTAYLAAGLTDLDGTHVYAVEVTTGRLRWQNNTSGHLDAASQRGIACQGELLLNDGRLYLAGGNAVSPGVYDTRDGRCLSPPPTSHGTSALRGRELQLVNGQVTVSGQPLYSRPEAPVFDGSCKWHEMVLLAKNGRLTFVQEKGPTGTVWKLVAQTPDGQSLWTQPLPAEPVRWGLALDASGRAIVTLRGGRVLCVGAAPQ